MRCLVIKLVPGTGLRIAQICLFFSSDLAFNLPDKIILPKNVLLLERKNNPDPTAPIKVIIVLPFLPYAPSPGSPESMNAC